MFWSLGLREREETGHASSQAGRFKSILSSPSSSPDHLGFLTWESEVSHYLGSVGSHDTGGWCSLLAVFADLFCGIISHQMETTIFVFVADFCSVHRTHQLVSGRHHPRGLIHTWLPPLTGPT